MGNLIQWPDRFNTISGINKKRFYELRAEFNELRAEFAETFKRLQAADTFEEKQSETNNLQRIVQEVQLILLEQRLRTTSEDRASPSKNIETIA